jgi:flavodoxin
MSQACPLAVLMSFTFLGFCACSVSKMDAITGATKIGSPGIDKGSGEAPGRAVIILASASGGNTEKLARAMSAALGARILSPAEVKAADLSGCAIVGFGSGIIDQAHHEALLSCVDALPPQEGKKAFIFSTSGVSRQFALKHDIDDPHAVLRSKLEKKGFAIAGEFNCAGFNANGFLKLFGGMNRGRPNQNDLAQAGAFARGLVAAQ